MKSGAKSRQMDKTVRQDVLTFIPIFGLTKRSQIRQYHLSYCLMALSSTIQGLLFSGICPNVKKMGVTNRFFWQDRKTKKTVHSDLFPMKRIYRLAGRYLSYLSYFIYFR